MTPKGFIFRPVGNGDGYGYGGGNGNGDGYGYGGQETATRHGIQDRGGV